MNSTIYRRNQLSASPSLEEMYVVEYFKQKRAEIESKANLKRRVAAKAKAKKQATMRIEEKADKDKKKSANQE